MTTLDRAVYLLSEGGSVPSQYMCAPCMDQTIDPVYAHASVIARDDSRHCYSCDWHDREFYDYSQTPPLWLGECADCEEWR